ncbi:divalent-cation tolerance protein CutA [Akkermansiaceae bacterium]|nr:divalent-cation tolerance protein CutA [Akkermansiaceae bacterium]
MGGNGHAGDGLMLVLCTFPDLEAARRIGSALVSGGLAACVNLVPKVESMYLWKGEMQTENEVLAIFKIVAGGFAEFEQGLLGMHPYEVPEILGIEADAVNAGYLGWALGGN